ncbi:FeoB-associated Cys-rich membrane protein [Fervidibacillus halotolerans]|uniref:FeoB-associated Cys-rich membrane protein n=2 Tax=Fervidibacillus halotolerans TaxID=2980027 RepID=A0A9E8M259_9BACI|nr:FeoB-associated Cys-rich membrane protein [Fervidibacillus halotolerans]WAA13851.1 FeoB-associated Cys-rich membrane protein [Fervidibacillus halotolerans]
MLIDFLLGGAIFSYAIWALVKHIKKTKAGKCASCALKDYCQSSCIHDLNKK